MCVIPRGRHLANFDVGEVALGPETQKRSRVAKPNIPPTANAIWGYSMILLARTCMEARPGSSQGIGSCCAPAVLPFVLLLCSRCAPVS